MRITRGATARAACAAAVAFAVAGCAGASDGNGPGAGGDEAAVQTVFRSYHAALLARDFATACGLNAPETNAELVRNVEARGGSVSTCEEALAAVYGGPGAAAVADKVSTSARVQRVAVTGDSATVSWTFDNKGQPQSVDTGLRRIDGQWRLLAVGA